MSNLRVATVETENETTDLTLTTGNTSGPEIVIAAGNNDINLTGDLIISGNVTATSFSGDLIVSGNVTATSFSGDGSNLTGISTGISTGKAIAMAIVFG